MIHGAHVVIHSKHPMRRLFILSAVVAFLWACSDSDPVDVRQDPPPMFEGILETDATGTVLGGDTTDWVPAPETNGLAIITSGVMPAYPNPTTGSVVLGFALADTDSVVIVVYDRPGAPPVDSVLNSGGMPPGTHRITWDPQLPPGLYRVVIKSALGLDSYGDVQLEE